MMDFLKIKNFSEFSEKIYPKDVYDNEALIQGKFEVEPPISENEFLSQMKTLMNKNSNLKCYIGCGYHPNITPPVILRNLLENPIWYTAYTPYQSEVSQGRLESLINFQTMISEMTGIYLY